MSAPSRVAPGFVWSLWDMLIVSNSKLVANFHLAGTVYQHFRAALAAPPGQSLLWDVRTVADLKEAVEHLSKVAEDLEFGASKEACANLIYALGILEKDPGEVVSGMVGRQFRLGREVVQEFFGYLEYLARSFIDEFKAKPVFILGGSAQRYFNGYRELFKASLVQFPTTEADAEEACKCMAFERHTAAVCHCMRILEAGLDALQAAVQVERPKENWGGIIDQIEKKIGTIRKQSAGAADEQWYSEAATQFTFFKNAWRNYAAHRHSSYNGEKAEEILNATRAFMGHLATRLNDGTV
ncbi:MAG TPA: hypothetical protein VF138_00120 [Caulobacteraceae bacterium]